MKQLLFVGSLICIIVLILGSILYPQSIFMELAGKSVALNIFRAAIGLTLLAVLLTKPPRSLSMRMYMGLFASGLTVAGITICLQDSMHVLDALLYLGLGCALGVEALEIDEVQLVQRPVQNT